MTPPEMTLRDYFAGQAIVGLIARMTGQSYEASIESSDWSFEADDAYNIADQLMSRREEPT
jgi:hypothetical protein